MEIKNNVFIITGGASGLGAASARMIVDNGGKVVLADVQVEAGEKLAAELKGKFVKCKTLPLSKAFIHSSLFSVIEDCFTSM